MNETLNILAIAISPDMWDLGLSIGIFLSVSMLIVGVFGQGGQIEMSVQRQMALSTGHSDRKTVFENPTLRPVMWLLLVVAHRLAMPKTKDWLRRQLVAAGSPNYYTAEEYFAVSLLAGSSLAVILEAMHLLAYGNFSVAAIVVGFAAGMSVALFSIHDKAAKRVRIIAKRVPYALDLIALAMGAGATFTEAIKTIVRENAEDPFHVELKTLLAEVDLGSTRRQALENLSSRVPLEMLRAIVASITQAEELGTPLSDVMHSQATLLRLQRSVRAEHAAATASVRILLPGLLIMLAVILAVFAPFILRAVQKGLF